MKLLRWFLLAFGVTLLICAEVMAQPSLPSAPSQAPIDGGLGILAAAGGSYALSKLKKRKTQQEEDPQ